MRIVMVVDDEPMLRALSIELLEDAGHTVVDFSNAAAAIAYCDQPGNEVAAIVTDINMPGDLDGLDLARHVRATRPGTNVVVTSGRYDAVPGDIRQGVTFVSKPWTGDLLLSAIAKRMPEPGAGGNRCLAPVIVAPKVHVGPQSGIQAMSSTSDKASGLANEAIGNIKQGVGKVTGSEKLQAEGLVQEAKGHAQKAVGDTKDAVKTGVDKTADVIDRKL